jgi:hypothetical protein
MKKNVLLVVFMIAVCGIHSCKKIDVKPAQTYAGAEKPYPALPNSNTNMPGELNLVPGEGCTPTQVTLIAGQYIDAGTVKVTNNANYIYVTYTTANGWFLTQTHLFVGNCALVPVNGQGNPVPGQFPYAASHTNLTSYTYQIPVSQIPVGGCGCIAAHSVVVKLDGNGNVTNTQTGWGQGVRINPNGGNWGMKFEYCSCAL